MKSSEQSAKARWFKRRYELFSKYDQGIRVSEEMWFSVTPEEVAMTVAGRVKARWPEAQTVVDICGGAGGNSIAFARLGFKVIYIDIDPHVLQDAAHNAGIYACRNIEFHLGDALEMDLTKLADPKKTIVHASPEWGGPAYKNQAVFDVEQCGPPVGALSRTLLGQGFNRILMFLPRNSNLNQLTQLRATALENIHVGRKKNALAINAVWDEGETSDESARETSEESENGGNEESEESEDEQESNSSGSGSDSDTGPDSDSDSDSDTGQDSDTESSTRTNKTKRSGSDSFNESCRKKRL